MKKCFRTGAKLLAALASAFLMCNVIACDDGGGSGNNGNDKPTGDTSSIVDYRIALTFDEEPTVNLSSSGSVRLYKLASNGTVGGGSDPASSSTGVTLVDTIKANEGETKTAATYYTGASSTAGKIDKIAVKDNLLYVDGNALVLVPHTDENGYTSLEANTTYFVYADAGVISGKLNGTDITSINDASVWTFKTGAAPSISNNKISVAQDGTGDFYTIQGAFDYLRSKEATGDWTINVAAGTYHERLFYYGAANITLVGETKDAEFGRDVKVNWKNADDWGAGGARSRATFLVQGTGNMVIKNMTFTNTYDRTDDGTDGSTQAETLSFDSTGNLIVYNSSFYSHQDTLYIGKKGNRSWFYKCYIEGDVDFIWGYADVALFEECSLNCVYDSGAGSHAAYIFASRSDITEEANKGFVLLNCDVNMEEGNTVYYGRNSGSDTQATLLGNTFTGEGTLSDKLYYSKPSEYVLDDNDDLAIGYKDFNNYTSKDKTEANVVDTTNRLEGCDELTARVANREYSGRYIILNRGYSKTDGKYATASTLWDISAYESEFSATADTSKSQIFVESVATWKLVGGNTVTLKAYDISGKDITSSVTWTKEEKLADSANYPNAIVTSLTNGVVVTAAQTSGTVTVKATSGNFSDIAYIYVIPTYIKVETVTFSAGNATSLNQGALAAVDVTLSAAEGVTDEVSDTSVVWTVDDDAVLQFFDSSNNAFVSTITTATPTVQIYGLKAGSAKITATSADATKGTSDSITVSSTVAEWNPTVAGVQVNTDVQSGVVGTYNTMVIDATTNNSKNGSSAKMGMKVGNTRIQTRNVILSIPVTADCDIVIALESAPTTEATAATASGLAYQGLYADGNKIVWDAETNTYTVKVDYETQAVAGDALEVTASTKGDSSADFTNATKYAQVAFGSKDVYITSITRTTSGQSYEYVEATPYDVSIAFADSADVELDLNGTTTVTRAATVTGADAAKVTVVYSSTDTTVASVDTDGKVTAVGKGTATIKASVPADSASESFKTATYNVSVADSSVNGAYTHNLGASYSTWLAENYSSGQITGEKGVYDHLVLDAETVSGANFKYDGGNACLTTSNGTIYIPVTGDCTITVTCHSYNSQYIGVAGSDGTVTAINDAGGTSLVYEYTGEAGYVPLTTTTAGKVLYLYKIVADDE